MKYFLCLLLFLVYSQQANSLAQVQDPDTGKKSQTYVYSSILDQLKRSLTLKENLSAQKDEVSRQLESVPYVNIDFAPGTQLSSNQKSSFMKAAEIWNRVIAASFTAPAVHFESGITINNQCNNFLRRDYSIPSGNSIHIWFFDSNSTNFKRSNHTQSFGCDRSSFN